MAYWLAFTVEFGRGVDFVVRSEDDLAPFVLPVDGFRVAVQCQTSVSSFSWSPKALLEDPSRQGRFRTTHFIGLIAFVSSQAGPKDWTAENFAQMSRAAEGALRATVAQLRDRYDNPRLDVRLSTFRYAYCHQGDELVDDPSGAERWKVNGQLVTASHWSQIADRARANERTPMEREWLMDARSFGQLRNNNMALIAAATACEVSMFRLVESELIGKRRVSAAQARKFSAEVSRREQPTLLAHFGLLDEGQAASLTRTFELRNAIVHGQRRTAVSEQEVEAAIEVARALQRLTARRRRTKPRTGAAAKPDTHLPVAALQ